jgi:hypothetical protein
MNMALERAPSRGHSYGVRLSGGTTSPVTYSSGEGLLVRKHFGVQLFAFVIRQ